jgi:hypothetical protein
MKKWDRIRPTGQNLLDDENDEDDNNDDDDDNDDF